MPRLQYSELISRVGNWMNVPVIVDESWFVPADIKRRMPAESTTKNTASAMRRTSLARKTELTARLAWSWPALMNAVVFEVDRQERAERASAKAKAQGKAKAHGKAKAKAKAKARAKARGKAKAKSVVAPPAAVPALCDAVVAAPVAVAAIVGAL